MATVTITIASNGCPPLNPVSVNPGDDVKFVNNCATQAKVSKLHRPPVGNPNGKNLSKTHNVTVPPNGGTKTITINTGTSGTYDYDVDTCNALGGTAQMIVGGDL